MRPELAGALIRRARLEKNWSQEGLCRGICSVSWLSKIEAGREGADPELVSALFVRLGLDMAERPGDAELIEPLLRGGLLPRLRGLGRPFGRASRGSARKGAVLP
ncbi:MAG: helix-turn-helix domain-containing protein [Lachnospiraceae bacterium]